MLQRQISIERDEPEAGLEALEEPLKAKKRRESRQGTTLAKIKNGSLLVVATLKFLSYSYSGLAIFI